MSHKEEKRVEKIASLCCTTFSKPHEK